MLKRMFKLIVVMMIAVVAVGTFATAAAQDNGKLEVFSWWTSGGEAAALQLDTVSIRFA